jgi:hypothetical protein
VKRLHAPCFAEAAFCVKRRNHRTPSCVRRHRARVSLVSMLLQCRSKVARRKAPQCASRHRAHGRSRSGALCTSAGGADLGPTWSALGRPGCSPEAPQRNRVAPAMPVVAARAALDA